MTNVTFQSAQSFSLGYLVVYVDVKVSVVGIPLHCGCKTLYNSNSLALGTRKNVPGRRNFELDDVFRMGKRRKSLGIKLLCDNLREICDNLSYNCSSYAEFS